MKKTRFAAGIACTLMVALLACCDRTDRDLPDSNQTEHTHAAVGGWISDRETHRQLCACGEEFNVGEHTLEDITCIDCGCEIAVFEDGSSFFMTYDEYGNWTFFGQYASDGTAEFEERYEYTYDENGNIATEKCYNGDVLSSEHEWHFYDDGYGFVMKNVSYSEDGSKSVYEYDENENFVYNAYFSADGEEEYAYHYDYADDGGLVYEEEYWFGRLAAERSYFVDEDGVWNPRTDITYNEDGSFTSCEYNEHGDMTVEIYADSAGKVEVDRRFENVYDADGNKTLTKTYEFGTLVEEVEFRFGSDDEGWWSMSGKTTRYHADGTRTVEDMDPEGNWSYEITYAADGTVLSEIRYEYEHNEDGDIIASTGYENGRLFHEMHEVLDADGIMIGVIITEYDEDGSKTVFEYDEYMEYLGKTVYDATGAVIEKSE